MSIPQADRKSLPKQIEMEEQYQKTMYTGHCSENADCITHCTTFGIRYPKCPKQHRNCSHPHNSDCPDCINIICTLDEIRKELKQLTMKKSKGKRNMISTTSLNTPWSGLVITFVLRNKTTGRIKLFRK